MTSSSSSANSSSDGPAAGGGGLEQFVTANVPRRSRFASAVFEYVAGQRGLEVERFNRAITLVRFPDAMVPFHGLNGPDSSDGARVFRASRDAQRCLLRARGVPVPRWSMFATSQERLARKFADDVGWPVTVRPARLAGPAGVTDGVADGAGFPAAWRRAIGAYDVASGGPVLVEEQVRGQRLHVFVVGDRVVAVTHQRPAAESGAGRRAVHDLIERTSTASADVVDVTDAADPRIGQLALDALRAIPGMSYGTVEITVPASAEHPPEVASDAGASDAGAHDAGVLV